MIVDNEQLEKLKMLEAENAIIRDDSIDIKQLEKLSAEGDADAMIELGDCYFHGIEVHCNQDKAYEMYEKAIALGSAEAYWRAGQCCMLGMGTYADETKAISYFEKSAEMGSIEGSAQLGTALFTGSGTRVDYERAAQLLQYAAEGGNSAAAFLLAAMHFDGIGVEIIYDKTVYWCRNAVVDDNEDAMELLAVCYYEGLGTLKNDILAFSWFRYLANKGRPRSQFYFGKCYEYGVGVHKDIEVARAWYRKAYENGFIEAEKKIKSSFFIKKKEAEITVDPEGSYYNKLSRPDFDMERLKSAPKATYNEKPFFGADVEAIMTKVRDIIVKSNAENRMELINTIMLSQDDSFELDETSRFIYMTIVRGLLEDFPMVQKVLKGNFEIPPELRQEDAEIEKKIRTMVTADSDVLLPDVVEMYMSFFKESLYIIRNRGRIQDSYNKLQASYSELRAKMRVEKELRKNKLDYIKDYILPAVDETGKELVADFVVLDQAGIFVINVIDNPYESLSNKTAFKFMDSVKPIALDGYSQTKKCAEIIEGNINERLARIPTDYNYLLPQVILVAASHFDETDTRRSNHVIPYTKLVSHIQALEPIIEEDDLDMATSIVQSDRIERDILPIDNFRKYIIDLSLSLTDYYEKLQESSKELTDYLLNV